MSRQTRYEISSAREWSAKAACNSLVHRCAKTSSISFWMSTVVGWWQVGTSRCKKVRAKVKTIYDLCTPALREGQQTLVIRAETGQTMHLSPPPPLLTTNLCLICRIWHLYVTTDRAAKWLNRASKTVNRHIKSNMLLHESAWNLKHGHSGCLKDHLLVHICSQIIPQNRIESFSLRARRDYKSTHAEWSVKNETDIVSFSAAKGKKERIN